ncbi:hypothetical protein [Brevibacillus fluminis]|uniref:hypothetical protein n=1 Tax=Brevibacillus fluminis TaxID=511487 RepID=UPI0011CD5C7E|nr:hypothetical protein [Brevibacillus fluminis]
MKRSREQKRASIYGSSTTERWAVGGSDGMGATQGGALIRREAKAEVFVGPSVEGGDKEYVHVLSGKVNHVKPSFC